MGDVLGTRKPSTSLTSRAFRRLITVEVGYFASEITNPEDAMFSFAPTAQRVVTVPTW